MAETTWPTGVDYVGAVQRLHQAGLTERLRMARHRSTASGLPMSAAGQHAVVFRLDCDEGPLALRCFTAAPRGIGLRYRALDAHLRTHPISRFAAVTWLDAAVQVGDTSWPAVQMEWIDGEPLHRHVEAHLDDRAALERLALEWSAAATEVAQAGITHGDYQHGNILVEADGTVRLVDFDATAVPGLSTVDDHELGHPAYQHPRRAGGDLTPEELDAFSALVISVSLRAVAERPELWERFHDGDNLLVGHADLQPASAHRRGLWAELSMAADPAVREGAERVLDWIGADVPDSSTVVSSGVRTGGDDEMIPAGDGPRASIWPEAAAVEREPGDAVAAASPGGTPIGSSLGRVLPVALVGALVMLVAAAAVLGSRHAAPAELSVSGDYAGRAADAGHGGGAWTAGPASGDDATVPTEASPTPRPGAATSGTAPLAGSGGPPHGPRPSPTPQSTSPGGPAVAPSPEPDTFPASPPPTSTPAPSAAPVESAPAPTSTPRPVATPLPAPPPTSTPLPVPSPTPLPTQPPTPTTPPAPVVAVSGPSTVRAGEVAAFTSTSAHATELWWAWGNGRTSSGASATYAWGAPGTYNVTLSASGPGGSASATATVHVLPGRPAATVQGPTVVTTGGRGQYSAQVNQWATACQWVLHSGDHGTQTFGGCSGLTVDCVTPGDNPMSFRAVNQIGEVHEVTWTLSCR